MIHKLSFSNFHSFKDEVTIDFVVDKNAPNTDSYVTNNYDERISKIMTIVGANASGKTNLLRSIVFLKWFINDSFLDLKPKDKIENNFEPFIFCKEKGNSMFSIVFEINNEMYEYNLELTKEKVYKENLSIKNTETNRMNLLFDRKLRENEDVYDIKFEKMDLPLDFGKMVRLNASILSTAKQINNPCSVKIADYFSNIQSNIDDIDKQVDKYKSLYEATEFFRLHPLMKDKVENVLKHFDLGLSKFLIEEWKREENKESVFFPVISHKYIDGEEEGKLPLFSESGGTLNLYILLKDILSALDTGNVVIFDELDNNLHPLMIPEIINLFKSKNHNPKNAQIFFSTHNAQILNELDKQQIIIVEKDENNISDAWSLNSVEGVRTDDNYYAKYLAGVYGGIPRF